MGNGDFEWTTSKKPNFPHISDFWQQNKQTNKPPKTVLSLWINFEWKTTFTIFWIIQWVPRLHKASEGSFIALLNKYSCFNGRFSSASFICNDHAQASGQVWVKSQGCGERALHSLMRGTARWWRNCTKNGQTLWFLHLIPAGFWGAAAGREKGRAGPFFPCAFWRTGWLHL